MTNAIRDRLVDGVVAAQRFELSVRRRRRLCAARANGQGDTREPPARTLAARVARELRRLA
jgi:hypothetical protein